MPRATSTTPTTHMLRCVKPDGHEYDLLVPARSMPEAAARATAAGHRLAIEGPLPPPPAPVPPAPPTPTPPPAQSALPPVLADEQVWSRLHSLLSEQNTLLARIESHQHRLASRTHWPMAVTALLAWAALVGAAPLLIGRQLVDPANTSAMKTLDTYSGVYMVLVGVVWLPWVLVVTAVTLGERFRR